MSGEFDVAARLKKEKLEQQQKAREAEQLRHKILNTPAGGFDVAAHLKREKL